MSTFLTALFKITELGSRGISRDLLCTIDEFSVKCCKREYKTPHVELVDSNREFSSHLHVFVGLFTTATHS